MKENSNIKLIAAREIAQKNVDTNSQSSPKSSRYLIKKFLNKEIIMHCLESIDIFASEILEDPLQKSKVIRDVYKSVQLAVYDKDVMIFNKGDHADCFYLVIVGSVSLCMPIYKEKDQKQQVEAHYDYSQIDNYQKGTGFGESEFISGRKRSLAALVGEDNSVIGSINVEAFQEIITSYKQRVYYKKMELFSRCPLLRKLNKHQLQFIVNNAKPINFTISNEITKQGEKPKCLILMIKGQVDLIKQTKKDCEKDYGKKQYGRKGRLSISINPCDDGQQQQRKARKVVAGIIEEGEFIGDCEIALGIPCDFSSICKTEKVQVYSCDERIIMSQMNEQAFLEAAGYYHSKKLYYKQKFNAHKQVKHKFQKDLQKNKEVILTKQQQQKKRRIMNKYVQKIPSLIGCSSPKQISLMINRKYQRILKSSSEIQALSLPLLNVVATPKVSKIKRNGRRLSPILKQKQQLFSRFKHIRTQQHGENQKSLEHRERLKTLQHREMSTEEIPFQKQPRSLLIEMASFSKKVDSLHERIAKQQRENKQEKVVRGLKAKTEQSIGKIEIKKIQQILSKIKRRQNFQLK